MQPIHEYETILRRNKIAHLPKHYRSVLDVGCGDGSIWDNIEHRPELYGIEPNEQLRELAHKSGYFNMLFCDVVDAIDYGAYTSNFDCVTMFGVLEHIENDKQFLMCYSDANSIYITVPNAGSFHRELGVELGLIESVFELGPQDLAIDHKRVYDIGALQELVALALPEFKIMKQGSTTFKPFSSDEMVRYIEKNDQMNKVAYQAGLVGQGHFWGAELFMLLERDYD